MRTLISKPVDKAVPEKIHCNINVSPYLHITTLVWQQD